MPVPPRSSVCQPCENLLAGQAAAYLGGQEEDTIGGDELQDVRPTGQALLVNGHLRRHEVDRAVALLLLLGLDNLLAREKGEG
jgi:hypothetical protein